MKADMVKTIVKEIETEYNVKVEVDYDFMPADAGSVLDLIGLALDEDVGDWITSGETYVLYSKSGEKKYVDILLLKRGVELNFELPQSLSESASEKT